MSIAGNILEAIGNTPLVELRRVVPPEHARVLVKLEGYNPTGSMKDRMAIAVIERAESDGRLPPGGTVVEYSGGSTGASLALVCAARGYGIRIVTSDAFSQEKRDHMRALGAGLIEVPSRGGGITKELIEEMIELAKKNGLALSAGHSFVIFLGPGFYPINVLNAVKAVPEVCRIFCATANPVEVIIAETGQGRGILGVVDGLTSKGLETEEDAKERKEFLRMIGYKL